MKTTTSLLIATLFAAGASLASAQYESDGPFGPVAQVTPRNAIEKQMASPAERAMNNADMQATVAKKDRAPAMNAKTDSRHDAFGQVDSAR